MHYKRKIYDIHTTSAVGSDGSSMLLDDGTGGGKFGYCKRDRQWFFYKKSDHDQNDGGDPCLSDESKLAYSSKTDLFDISASFDESWYSAFGTPIDMYFVSFGTDSVNDCNSFNDGVCDVSLNSLTYQYDGGDCCSSSCFLGDNCVMGNID